MRREIALRVIKWFTKAQRQQKEIDDEYIIKLRVKKVEKKIRKIKTAARNRGGRKEKKKKKRRFIEKVKERRRGQKTLVRAENL